MSERWTASELSVILEVLRERGEFVGEQYVAVRDFIQMLGSVDAASAAVARFRASHLPPSSPTPEPSDR